MDIHAPEHPIHTFKDFAMHILVVTCGILIALGLEGVRESLHERHLVRETRENIRLEMDVNLRHSQDELRQVKRYEGEMKQLVADFPSLAEQHPEQVGSRLEAVVNPEYFFTATSWQTALSTGVLAHMAPEEVIRYAGASEDIGIYSKLQQQEKLQEDAAKAFVAAHPKLSAGERAEAMERLVMLYRSEQSLGYVGPSLQEGIERALVAAKR